ncbi:MULTISPECIES: metallophosphoesterase family protein [unclassified Streptomyces]|uniref:metallophosphoesterase family protein n=1 Tax=unclassified Streptomyces TaxID=2593676 RepID=UPI00236735E4|nr:MULTISPECIES: metallophosphoesterase family protein [unclassified Streptomyces]MDF3140723.1 metallophosphoesterase family protein [Streptomyces sp. T21Q-yed]WDF41022.1 metallophosphoesterase family protein [Streptomyces sp. T12]
MVTRVAVLSDIHAVLPAVEAVLAEPEVAAADLIVLSGDIACGPQPVQVMDLLTGLGDRAAWIRGNADRELVEYRRGLRTSIPDPIGPSAAESLREDQVDFLERLPTSLTFPVEGLGEVLFCHATPRDDEEVVLADSGAERWAEVFADVDPAVTTVVCGHTHMPFTRLAAGRLVVNPGSVGMPYGRIGAHWALLGPGVELRRTLLDVPAAAARIAADSTFGQAAEWADYVLNARATEEEAFAIFAPRDGREG